MAEIKYIVKGTKGPFMVLLKENDENGNTVKKRLLQQEETGIEQTFGVVPSGTYVVVVYDTASGYDSSTPVHVTTTTTTTTTTTLAPTTTTTTTTVKLIPRLNFSLQVYNEITSYPLSNDSRHVILSLTPYYSGGTPQFRVYPVSGIPGVWQNFDFVDGVYTKKFASTSGSHIIEFNDNDGMRQLATFTIFDISELLCLNIAGSPPNYLVPIMVVENDKVRFLGYPTSGIDIALNDNSFKSWNPSGGAEFTNSELNGLGITSMINDVKLKSVSGACTIVPFKDVYLGDYV